METLELKIYEFHELKGAAKGAAIEQVRSKYYEYNDFAAWAVDDCSLLNPRKYNKQGIEVIGNTRKNVYFDTGRAWYLQINEAIDILDEDKFLKFLGIPKKMRGKVYYTFFNPGSYRSTELNIEENETDYEFTHKENEIIENSKRLFSVYVDEVLRALQANIDYRFTDEAIIEDIEANEIKFLATGKTEYYV